MVGSQRRPGMWRASLAGGGSVISGRSSGSGERGAATS